MGLKKNINIYMISKSFRIIQVLSIIILISLLLYKSFKKEGYINSKFKNFQELEEDNINLKISDKLKERNYNLSYYSNREIKPGEILLQDNQYLPECCVYNSEYSSSNGCPCITQYQEEYLKNRGMNRLPYNKIYNSNMKNIYFSPSNSFKNNDNNDIFLRNNIYITKNPEELKIEDINNFKSMLIL